MMLCYVICYVDVQIQINVNLKCMRFSPSIMRLRFVYMAILEV